MNVAVIGSTGFLGRYITAELQQLPTVHLATYSRQPLSAGHNAFFYSWPDTCFSTGNVFPDIAAYDVIIYAAGAGVQPATAISGREIFALNFLEPFYLLQYLQDAGFAGQLVTFGSYFEIGENSQSKSFTEEEFLCLRNRLPNAYCIAKSQLTKLADGYTRAGLLSFRWLHLILTNIYGPGENPQRLIPYILAGCQRGDELHFTAGTQVRQYTYAGDVCRVVAALLGRASGIYHTTHEPAATVRQVTETVLKMAENRWGAKATCRFDLADRRDSSMPFLSIDPQGLAAVYGLTLDTSLEEGIAKYLNHETS